MFKPRALASLMLAVCPQIAAAAEKYRAESEGWELAVPNGWKHAEQSGRVMFGSDTEPGLIVAWFAPGATWEQMRASARDGIKDPNINLSPIGEAKEKKLGKNRALVAQLRGVGADGVDRVAESHGDLRRPLPADRRSHHRAEMRTTSLWRRPLRVSGFEHPTCTLFPIGARGPSLAKSFARS